MRVMCGGSPRREFCFFLCFRFIVFYRCRGVTQERRLLYSRSPLYVFVLLDIEVGFIQCRGDSQGSRNYDTLVLPSLNRNLLCFSCQLIHVGEIHRVSVLVTLVLPPVILP